MRGLLNTGYLLDFYQDITDSKIPVGTFQLCLDGIEYRARADTRKRT